MNYDVCGANQAAQDPSGFGFLTFFFIIIFSINIFDLFFDFDLAISVFCSDGSHCQFILILSKFFVLRSILRAPPVQASCST